MRFDVSGHHRSAGESDAELFDREVAAIGNAAL
jgi:hypothetical protein